ncbi:cytochrome P450 [Aulographum hederae CBS 113979]|uniref:Cytochrome P450 n=1 Tax=Aulographum hederae CBS 113979 TaxID=1176131 RepID=A0A6G1H275_9PEZI|nr:cytochrome P450 [Aulographum hederae CBS 113979]
MESTLHIRGTGDRILLGVGLLFSGLFIYTITKTIYRLYFHPLSKFPGPIINRCSNIPASIWVLTGRLPMETKKLHDRYGPVLRLSPDELSFTSARAWTDIYGHKAGRRDLSKHPIHVGSVDPIPGVSTISMADIDTHARQRKALSHGFSKQALWSQEDIVQGFVDKLMVNFSRFAEKKEKFDVVKWFNFITFDVIGDLSFGESFGCLDKGDFHFWITLIFDAVKAGAIETASRRVATPGSSTQMWLKNMMIPSALRQRRADHLNYSRTKVMRRIQDTKTDRKDFIHYILKQSEHYDLSQDEVIVNAALFIVAGSETTASSLSALTNNFLRYPKVFAKAKDEIRNKFTSESEINIESVTNELPYLNACIEENLRMFPPAPIGFLRAIQKSGDNIDGNFIPGGTAVSVSSWCAHHSKDNFKDPDSFIPERWLSEEYQGDQKLASRPFSLGPRGCIGKDLSYVEMRLVLTRMIWNFDIVNADDANEWDAEGNMKNMKAYSTWQKPQLNVYMSKVKR